MDSLQHHMAALIRKTQPAMSEDDRRFANLLLAEYDEEVFIEQYAEAERTRRRNERMEAHIRAHPQSRTDFT